ncbi:biofilm PGA synthesis N-glycosyltransferase PgaC [Clostridiales Family XIII bacterium PM5-7]
MMDAIKTFLFGVDVFFVAYLIGYSTFLFLSVIQGGIKLFQKREDDMMESRLHHDIFIPISIIVPAHNEEVTILDSVSSLLAQNYKLYEIIIVDDGSTDRTAEKVIEHFHMTKIDRPVQRLVPCQDPLEIYECQTENRIPITFVRKEQGGKADSLNTGINVSQFPYFICMDADSMLQKDSLYEIIKPVLENDNVIACGGQVAVSNGVKLVNGEVVDYSLPRKHVTAMQVLEYERSFLASRIFMNTFNGNLIISGAFGLFKRDAVVKAGGYDVSTVGEDMELVVKLHAYCRANQLDYSIQYAPDAICWSQVPSTLSDLIIQRRRWHIGLFESLTKYKSVVGRKEYGLMGTISFLYFWIYELLSPYIEVFGLLTIVLSYFVNLINAPFMVLFFLVYATFGCILTLNSFINRLYVRGIHISFLDTLRAMFLCGFELVGLRFVLMVVRFYALIGYRKKDVVWKDLKRVKHDHKQEA